MAEIRMTEELVSQICKDKGFYRTPNLNTRLYLHFLGFSKIENLENFASCQALWLENNLIERIENLSKLTNLSALFLKNNQIKGLLQTRGTNDPQHQDLENAWVEYCAARPHLTANPFECPSSAPLISVSNLDISSNHLESIKGISFVFPNLEIFVANNNRIKSLDHELALLPRLTVVDLGNNQIDVVGEHEVYVEEFALFMKTLPKLATAIFHGNPFVRKTKGYRKKLICSCKTLKYIDDLPIFEDERIEAEAFASGGRAAELSAREIFKEQKRERHQQNMDRFDRMLNSRSHGNQDYGHDDDDIADVFIYTAPSLK